MPNWGTRTSKVELTRVCVALNVKSANNENKVVLSTRRQTESSVCPVLIRPAYCQVLHFVCAFQMESIILLCDLQLCLRLDSVRIDSISKVNRQRHGSRRRSQSVATHLIFPLICYAGPILCILHPISSYFSSSGWGIYLSWANSAAEEAGTESSAIARVVRAALMEIQLN